MSQESHPLVLNLERILPLLAKEIYSTHFAFLRENVQNAFDAIRMQMYRERQRGLPLSPHRIDVVVRGDNVAITDTGIGMTGAEMKEFYWSLGKTGKGTKEAAAAGVVGTFGIGGMANFGVATELSIESRTADNVPAIISSARLDTLSTSSDCIFYREDPTLGRRGTTVTAQLAKPIAPKDVQTYLQPIVRFLAVRVYVNGTLISGEAPPWVNSEAQHRDHLNKNTFRGKAGDFTASLVISIDSQGRPIVTIDEVMQAGKTLQCHGVLRTHGEPFSTHRYGFRLADIGLSTTYGLGGHIDCSAIKPTAGRDTLESDSKALLQRIVEIAELGITLTLAGTPSLPDSNLSFFRYVVNRGEYKLVSNATVRQYGADRRILLSSVRDRAAGSEVFYCRDGDPALLELISKQGKQIVFLSTDYYRRRCEEQYLGSYCSAKVLDVEVTAVKQFAGQDMTEDERSFIAGVEAILREKYIIPNVKILPVQLTRDAVVWVPKEVSTSLVIWLDIRNPQIAKILAWKGSGHYGQLVDLFVRDYVFPLIKQAIPSVTAEGFDTLLQQLQSKKEVMVISPEDVRVMEELSLAPRRSHYFYSSPSSELSIRKEDVLNANTIQEKAAQQGVSVESYDHPSREPVPAAVRSMKQTLAQLEINEKILDFARESRLGPWISGLYVAITLEAFGYYRDILQRFPRIVFVWGGYRASYLFFEREEAVLYYDLEFSSLLKPKGGETAGALPLEKDPLFTKNNIFLPVPQEFVDYFLPTLAPVRIVVRHEILTAETQGTLAS